MSCPKTSNQNRTIIAFHSNAVLALILSSITLAPAHSQTDLRDHPQSAAVHAPRPRVLTKKEGSSIVAVARDSQPMPRERRDCSHLVHHIYEHAGFPYPYADSKD